MKILLGFVGSATILATAASAAAHDPAAHHSFVPPGQVKWGAGPPSLPPGAQASVLYGDPAKEGPFSLRLKLPAGYRIPPHTHPKPEMVTVISGTFNVGMGATANRASTRALGAGGFIGMDPGTQHYVFIDRPTEIQLNSTGPWSITYVNPADDPRQKRR
jgi:quercetin dioxygenase-like cupin family protein